MTVRQSTLDELRREIDRIDDSLHDLIMARIEIVHQVGATKKAQGSVVLRPAREAEILRRLVARHQGKFPKVALVRIWRELMGATVGLQGPFSLAVTMPETGSNLMELARDQYGTAVPATGYRTPGQVVRAVADGSATVGIVPPPEDEKEGGSRTDAWWLALMADTPDLPRIIARLPFANPDPGRNQEALAIAKLSHDSTGFDRTWLGLETEPDVSRARLKTILGAAGLEPSLFAATHRSEGRWMHLVEVIGYAAADDPRVARLDEKRNQVLRACVLGGHAVPLGVEELSE
jgi:chorismate mutase/prephenate dehydratase